MVRTGFKLVARQGYGTGYTLAFEQNEQKKYQLKGPDL
jgi:hypothetical protein